MIERLRRQVVRIGLGLLVVAVFALHAAGVLRIGLIEALEHLAYDARLVLSMPRGVDRRLVIVDIDEKSLTAEGRWPWGRDRVAELVRQLFERYRVSLVAFDMVFAEPDESSGLRVLERLANTRFAAIPEFRRELEALRPQLDNDRLLAQVLERYPVILGYYFNPPAEGVEVSRIGALPEPTFRAGVFAGRGVQFLKAAGYGGNLPILQQAAGAAGHFIPSVDSDGIVRRVPMLYEFEGAYYESLSLAVARAVMGGVPVQPVFEPVPWGAARNYAGLEWLRLGDRLVPVDEHVQTLVPYRGPHGSFPYVSATDVLHGAADPQTLRDAVVLVGTTAPGLLDLRATPVQKTYPGVEIHANLISGILDGRLKAKPPYVVGAEFTILLAVGLLLALGLPLLTPVWATAVAVGAAAVSVALNFAVWQAADLVLPIASGLLMIGSLFLVDMSYGYFVETRGKRHLATLFGQYVPPELVEEMAKEPEHYSLAAESRELTVLFSDVRGFTTLSETLSARELAELMNQFLTPMTEVIHTSRGTIDKYMGDAIMAFWGAPLADPEHARHAVGAAMEMVRRLDGLNARFRERGWPELRIGVGVNTGTMSVGNMGSSFRMAYTVMGDAVNLGSRLEGLTKQYGVSIIVSESTRVAAPGFAYRELDRVRVKGKDEPVAIYEPLASADEVTPELADELKLYRQALKYYRAREWDMAELQFLNLGERSANPVLYRVYAERVAWFRANPPPDDWDGVFTFTTK